MFLSRTLNAHSELLGKNDFIIWVYVGRRCYKTSTLTKFTTNFNGDSSDDAWHHNDRALFADQQNTGKVISCSTIVMSISLFISSNSALFLFLPSLLFFSPVSSPLECKRGGFRRKC